MADKVRRLNPEELRAWRTLLRAHAELIRRLDHDLLTECGMGLADYEVLLHLSEAPRAGMRMVDLAKSVLVSPSGLTRRLDGLVKAGLVERRPCPSDKRSTLAVLSSQGKQQLREMAPTHLGGVRAHFIDKLAPGQLDQVVEIFGELAQSSAGGADDDEDGVSAAF